MTTLLDAVRTATRRHSGTGGLVQTQVPGLAIVRATQPSGLMHSISRPLVCLVVQGAKQVSTGAETVIFGAGQAVLITADVPIVSQITEASAARPYLSLALELDIAMIAELAVDMPDAALADDTRLRVTRTDAEMSEAALRLVQLLELPEASSVLHRLRLREMHYWLLAGRHGAAIRRLGWPDAYAARVARAVAVLRAEFDRPIAVERLAAVAGMSASSFHRHFLAVTTLSPLQFQKQLRLIEARRLMMGEGASASRAAFAVGYESVPQFTREYARMFGLPPVRDVGAARAAA